MRAVRRTSALLAGALVASAVATLPAQASGTTEPTTLAVEGTVRVVVVDQLGDTPSSDHRFTIVTDTGAEIPVDLPESTPADARFEGELLIDAEVKAALDSADLLPREGSTIAEHTRAGRIAAAEAEDQAVPLRVANSAVTAPAASAAPTPAVHKAYVARMTDQGSVDGTDDRVLQTVMGSLQYWVAESGGAITSFEAGAPLRSFDSTADIPATRGCGMGDPYEIWDQAADLFPTVDFDLPGNHLVVVVGDECSEPGTIGVATVGSSVNDGGASILSFVPAAFYSTSAHEIGHNFGLGHANLDGCGNPDDCEYLDLYSPMALAILDRWWGPPALGTLHRLQLGLTTAGEVASIDPLPGQPEAQQSFALSPRGSDSGLRGLLVTDPVTGSTYSIDWRRPRNSRDDVTFYGSAYSLDPPDPIYPGGIVIERQGLGADGAVDGEIYLSTRSVDGRTVGSFGAGSTFSPSDGLTVAVTSTGNDSTGATSIVSVTVDGTATPLISSATPTWSGSTVVGRTVTASPGTWTPGAEFTYDWRIDGVSTGLTGQSYSIPPTDVGRSLTVAVTGRKSGYLPATRLSTGSSVAPGTFLPGIVSSTPPVVGENAVASVAGWPAEVMTKYQWYANDVAMAGATSASFNVPATLLGTTVRVVVTGTRPGYTAASATSTAARVTAAQFSAATPRITGAARVGKTLKTTVGPWSPRPSYRYQWYANGKKITSKGTKSSFKLTSKQKGKRITVRVTAQKVGYATAAKTSKPTKKVTKR